MKGQRIWNGGITHELKKKPFVDMYCSAHTFTYSLDAAAPPMPAGVDINSTTGLITVLNTMPAGTYNLIVSVGNGVGMPAQQAFTLAVNPMQTVATPKPGAGCNG